MKLTFFAILFPLLGFAQWDGNRTPTYPELIEIYKKWDSQHAEIELYQMGESDTEFPIYLVLLNGAGDSLKTFQKAKSTTTVLINNAIHAGEPDGVNACLLWIEEWIKKGKSTKDLPVIAIIPAYNIGGMMNRSSLSRANQDGPEEYGFRGNAQNLDLNRDCIKMDSKNMKTFAKIYHGLEPDVFVDNHVSNGADYQYTLTLIHSMKERMSASMKNLMKNQYFPALTPDLKKKGWDWVPYVETMEETPESGLQVFNDLPRYAQGYAAIFNSISITVETHMLKPFPQRVQATKAYMDWIFHWSKKHGETIEKARESSVIREDIGRKAQLPFNYQLTNQKDSILFKGYEFGYKPSEVSGKNRLFYNRSKPFTKYIPYYQTYWYRDSVIIPKGYIISKEATEIIERLQMNGVEMIEMDSSMKQVHTIRIVDFETGSKPYEGHFIHRKVKSTEQEEIVRVPKGSVWIPCDQKRTRFIVSVLEPRCEDSYFAWNFMDSYLQEKEYFSAYVFEDEAANLLKENPSLRQMLENKKSIDPEFAKSGEAQLFFVYQNSDRFEKKTFNRLPIFKVY
ncbi:peptidase M14 [Fluviicola taffensis]|uniref:Peptidase, family M14 n=1 Tax=Fluviicola taffensis (strain DSM 16823 / NCIMB 13979 / RW262) TaxID=755732 RepID=F2IH56_FLUTR|nr:peptidase M14 [Fluviicola taffensis]AEA45870.1 peptidase, family M14 [Fluviicola taffensis DSM 16823]